MNTSISKIGNQINSIGEAWNNSLKNEHLFQDDILRLSTQLELSQFETCLLAAISNQ